MRGDLNKEMQLITVHTDLQEGAGPVSNSQDEAGMKLAIKVAAAAFQCNEVPVSCVFVSYRPDSSGHLVPKVEASAHNLTSKLKNVCMWS